MALLDLVLGTLQALDVALLAGPAALGAVGNLLGRLDVVALAEDAPVLPPRAAVAGVCLPEEHAGAGVVCATIRFVGVKLVVDVT